ncbi:MAG: DHA2 family efflux MFS transporter permease subunit [Candidatus Manganitrophaceae bacterium]|nr:MAG: DHA2 family efflux MFS transporter permease subunit [Candidatus Manganitrophaceae bacterium]
MSTDGPATTSARPENAGRPARNPWLIALIVTMATFMEVLDTTIVNVALSHIAGNLSAGLDESTWVLTSYLVSNAIILPMSGWFSSLLGRKRFYMTCVALFTVSSFLCGFAPSLGWLIFFRVLQGLGGGGLQPSEQSILVDTFPAEKRGMAFAVAGIAMLTAPSIGPTLGGWITDNYNWRWCFYINIPIGILSLILTSRFVTDPPHARPIRFREGFRIDYIGLGLIALGLGALQIVLDKGEREDWFDSSFIQGLALIALVALVFAVFWELRERQPVVDLKLLGERNFGIANLLMFMVGFALFGSSVLIPQMLQTQMGYTAQQAGMVLSLGALVVMVMMPMVGFLVSRIQPKWMVLFGVAVQAASLFYMTRFNLQMDFQTAMWARCFQAFGLAFLFVPINTAAYAYLPPGKNNNASALINLSRNMGASFGISAVTTLLAQRAQFHQNQLVGHLTPYDLNYQTALERITERMISAGVGAVDAARRAEAVVYRMLEQQATMLAYIDNFWILGWLFLAILPLVFLLKRIERGKGAAMH